MIFRDRSKARPVMDFMRFLHEVTAYNIVRSCRICKEETGGKKIAGVFYGYSLNACEGRLGPCNNGSLALKTVLESPDVDFLCAPENYYYRLGGEPGNVSSAYAGSYRLHGKLLWDEADHRTHLAHTGEIWSLKSLSETLSVCERGFGQMLTKGMGLWWFTLAGDDTFHQDEIMEAIAQMQKAGGNAVAASKEPINDVAVFVDEESYYCMRLAALALHDPLLRGMDVNFATMGAPYDLYLLSDIADAKMPDYKLYIFLNAFCVSDNLRGAIKTKVRRNKAVSVWFYAPGFIKEDGTFSEDAIQDLIGIHVRHKLETWKPQLTMTNARHPISSQVNLGNQQLGLLGPMARPIPMREFGPMFWVADPRAAILGRSEPDGPGLLAVRDFGSWRSVYCAIPWLSTDLLRGLIRYAGGHVYSTSDDTFYANRSFLMIHTAKAGQKHIALPKPCDVYDVLQAEAVGRNVTSVDVELPKGVTRIYRLQDTAAGGAVFEGDR